jgi:hypothetical protein
MTLLIVVWFVNPYVRAEEPAEGTSPAVLSEAPPAMEDSIPVDPASLPEGAIVDEHGQLLTSGALSPSEAIACQPTCMIDDFNLEYPMWYARGEASWLNRSSQGEVTTATVRLPNGLLGNNRISTEFDLEPGIRAFVGRNVWDGQTYIEFGYFGLNHWNISQVLTRDGQIGIIDTNVDLGFGLDLAPDNQRVDYGSDFHNAEANIRSYFNPNFAFIGGLRYIHLAERLVIFEDGVVNLTENNASVPFNYNAFRTTNVGNNWLGPHVGFDYFRAFTDDIRFRGLTRLGLGANFNESSIRQTREAISTVTQTPIRSSRGQFDEETAISTVLELSASLDVRLTRNVVLRGGYQFLWMYGIAVATEQSPNNILDPNGAQRQIENGADAIFFGPFAGLEISWGRVEY